MAYRYPPPFMNKLTSEIESYPPVHMMNFNIPPPGFRPTCAMEMWRPDTFQCHPQPSPQPSVLLPSNVHTVLQPQEWGQVNASCQEVHAHPTSDLLWVKDWLQRRKTTDTHSQQKQSAVPLKLFDARCMLKLCLAKLEELDSLQVDLKINCHDLSPSCWRKKWDHIKKVQAEISICLDNLHDPATLDALKMTLQKRKKKRLRERRQRALHKEALRESHIRRQQLHQNIDTWLKNMQELVEEAKRDESLKHEADQVLSEVTRKKSEAQRQINMLAALQKLRRVRAQMATHRGERVDAESGLRFVRVTEHLVKLWEDQLKGYEIEEQGLRVMLDEAVVERTKSEISQDKQILTEWKTLLFGKQETYSSFYNAAEQDVDAFIAIRHSWDKFMASPGVVMSSSIPVGWVLPSNPSSEKWESLLTNKEHLKM